MNEMKSNSDQIFSTFFFLCIFILQIKFHKDSSFRFMLLVYPFRLCFSSEAKLQVLNEQIGPRGTWTWKTTHLRAKLQDSINVWNLCTQKLLGKWETLAKEINVIVDRNIVRMPNKLFARSPFLHVSMRSRGGARLFYGWYRWPSSTDKFFFHFDLWDFC